MDKFLYELMRFLIHYTGPFLLGGLVFSVPSILITGKIIEKRFPLKLRKVNMLKRKYKKSLEKVKQRESTICFIYNIMSKTVDAIAKKIASTEKDL